MFRAWMSAEKRGRGLGVTHRRARLAVEELEPRTLLLVYTPAQIRAAYGVDQISFSGGTVPGDGAGETIAIVDAYYDPSIQSDLATFNSTYGLPQLDGRNGDGTFTQADLSNGTQSPPGDDWTLETALDVEWAHAIAPKANIVLVEAASDNQDAVTGEPTDLLAAVRYAATQAGAQVVSMSWGASESPYETQWDSVLNVPGVTFVAASGDSGAGTIWPAVSPYVVGVGGTTLNLTGSNTIASETGWGYGGRSFFLGGSGGGFSQYEALPSYQQNAGISSSLTQYGVRLSPDVAFVADPNTGLNVLDSADGGWFQIGGTSAGAPQWAALVAIADQGRRLAGLAPLGSTQTLDALYSIGHSSSYTSDFHDITRGSTGTAPIFNSSGTVVGQLALTAGPGYDLVTGLGTPAANLLVPALAGVSALPPAHGPLSATGQHLTATAGQPLSGVVAVVSDPGASAGDLTATLSWGDGSAAQTVALSGPDANGNFEVQGSHTYTAAGADTITVTVRDTTDSQTATATSAVTVQAAPTPTPTPTPTPSPPDAGTSGPVTITLGKPSIARGHKLGYVLLTVTNSGSSVLRGQVLLIGLNPRKVVLLQPDGMLGGMPFVDVALPPGGSGMIGLTILRVGRHTLVAADLSFGTQLLAGA